MRTQQIIEDYYDLPKGSLQLNTRKREIVFARQMCHYFMSKQKKYTLKKIGRLCGNRDHATILHSIRTINNLIEFDKNIKHDYEKLRSKILIEITEQEKTDAIIKGLINCIKSKI